MSDAPKSKLIIDEDWKTQVEREREQLKQPADDQPIKVPSAEGGSTAAAKEPNPAESLPPPTFTSLVTMLGTQALAALGAFDDPHAGAPQVEPEMAKHFIDLLGMLEEKTKGNLAADELALLQQSLHELRIYYVSIQK